MDRRSLNRCVSVHDLLQLPYLEHVLTAFGYANLPNPLSIDSWMTGSIASDQRHATKHSKYSDYQLNEDAVSELWAWNKFTFWMHKNGMKQKIWKNFPKGVTRKSTLAPMVKTASPLGLLETLPLDHGVTTKN